VELGQTTPGQVAIKAVLENTPGQRAGLRPGDQILEIDGQRVRTAAEVTTLVKRSRIGAKLILKLAAPSGTRQVTVTLEARPDRETMARTALEGKVAPDFIPTVVAGPKVARLSSLRGQVVLIDFFGTWCGPCREAMPLLARINDEDARRGLRILGISREDPEVVTGAAERFGLHYPLIVDADGSISDKYQVYGLPTAVVIDRRGVIRRVSVADVAPALEVVQALLREK
jgi:peroxiredoxin